MPPDADMPGKTGDYPEQLLDKLNLAFCCPEKIKYRPEAHIRLTVGLFLCVTQNAKGHEKSE
jgi:hypothetical protein